MSASTIARRVRAEVADAGAVPTLTRSGAWFARWVTGLPVAGRPSRSRFTWDGAQLPYVRHRYHYTWLNERAVEVAIGQHLVRQVADPRAVLEVGNVLAHYGPVEHRVVDKYETGPGVLNVDALDVAVDRPVDLVLSVSTLEHIGFDEPEVDPDKPRRVVAHLASLLAPGGRLVVTVPVGYNPSLDARLRDGSVGLTRLTALRRVTASNQWREAPVDDVWDCRYDALLMTASAVVVGELSRPA